MEVGMVDSNDYIYRFINGNLQENRKHSEVINKILAGYIDSDGSISLKINSEYLNINVYLSQAAVNDPDFEIIRSFQKFYNLGNLMFRFSLNEKESSRCDWKLGVKDSLKLFNLIGKHLVVKGTLFRDLIATYEEWVGKNITQEEFKILQEKQSFLRKHTGPLKKKKHPSWAWLAGYVAGDGHLCCRLDRKRHKYDKKVNKYYDMTFNELFIDIVSDIKEPLEFLTEHFKGSIYPCRDTHFHWKRSLGKGNIDFSEEFLSKLKPYMLHPKKYETIKRMLGYLRSSRD